MRSGDVVPLLYWDADVLLSWLEDHPERAPITDLLLADARAGKVEIVTSIISQVEVAFSAAERMEAALSADVESTINNLWAPGAPLRVVDVYPLIAARARNLIRDGIPRGWSGLRANDAIHLATAQQLGATEVHTYETKLPRYAEVLGIPICEPRTSQPRIV